MPDIVKIRSLPSASDLSDGDYAAIDNSTDGLRKVALGGIISDLKSAFGVYLFQKNKSIDYTAPTTIKSETYWECCLIECSEGDVFYVRGSGGNSTRLWMFSDASGNILKMADSTTTVRDFIRIQAPTNTAYLSVNSRYVNVKGCIFDDSGIQQNEIDGINDSLVKYNTYNILSPFNGINGTVNGVTYTFDKNKCVTTGSTGTSVSFRNIYSYEGLPDFAVPNTDVYFKVNSTNNAVSLAVFFYDSNNSQIGTGLYITSNVLVTIPSNCVKMLARINVERNTADASGTIEYAMLTHPTTGDAVSELENISLTMKGTLPDNTDADDLTSSSDTGVYLIDSSKSYSNLPIVIGFLFNCKADNNAALQIAYSWSGSNVFKRRFLNATWSEWVNISSITNNYTNEYTFENYNNTYNVTATPTITTDTNAYLAPSGDASDRTADIVSLLTNQGICRLGKGDYYVNNLQMPEGSTIIGAGNQTRIILSGTSAGYAIKMTSYCNVSDCLIIGSLTSIEISSSVGDRHGILWQGTYTQDQTTANQPINGFISNVRFMRFSGGAITCYDTGYGTFNQLEVTNVLCWNCNVGINISYFSEFHKFTNVRTASCWYGCINNGGNNNFVNCDFSTCKIGFLMDNENNQSPNNSHGSCVGCVFNHTDSNTGIGIKILNCNNGFIFDGCQIFFSQIYLKDSDGVVFSNCNFGANNCDITINGGGAILFIGNMHSSDPTKTITNNNHVIFTNCYVRPTGESVTMT